MPHILSTAPAPLPGTYWVLDQIFLAGRFLGEGTRSVVAGRIDALAHLDVARIFDLREAHEGRHQAADYEALVAANGADIERHPIPDFGVPPVAAMVALLDGIDRSIGGGEPVYLHCRAGIGRTGTTVGCWLIRHGLADPTSVFTVLDRLRNQGPTPGSGGSPETHAQRGFVSAWSLNQ